jgi:hypothetical protein
MAGAVSTVWTSWGAVEAMVWRRVVPDETPVRTFEYVGNAQSKTSTHGQGSC